MNNLIELNQSNNTLMSSSNGAATSPLEQKVQTSFKKAKESEDASICSFRPMMRRSYSLSQFDPTQKTKKEECEARSSALWECIEREPSKFGGYIYQFKARDEYNDYTPHPDLDRRINRLIKLIAGIFPAVELSAKEGILSYDITYDLEDQIKFKVEDNLVFHDERIRRNHSYLPDSRIQEALRYLRDDLESEIRVKFSAEYKQFTNARKNAKILQQLGYRFYEKNELVFKELPDREALLGAYQSLKETHPERHWPDFEITSSEGIADDESYAKAHFIGSLLSTGPEFVHDHDAHIIPRLHRVFEGANYYQKTEKELIQSVFSVYTKIYMTKEQYSFIFTKHSEKLNLLLGMTADTLFSLPPHVFDNLYDKFYVKNQIATVCEDLNWKSYVQRRFPKETPTNAEIKTLWGYVESAAASFVESREKS